VDVDARRCKSLTAARAVMDRTERIVLSERDTVPDPGSVTGKIKIIGTGKATPVGNTSGQRALHQRRQRFPQHDGRY
jgi:hypothetical protein